MKKIFSIVTILFSTTVFGYTHAAYFRGQYQGKSISGNSGVVCVYESMGKEYHVFVGYGVCPISINVD